ncbi:FkbM family methyltransferase [Rhodovulum euryhalinum]|uniref:FkbM family methyltransferase n=1 Tax=Rhodovulum euryhalinum TaxID=35805 RepID=A0A4R2L4E4_9RHOB|nr:FkbM family methyltransferase [Rhodovulum euryhalinum]TCO74005.1 FkbM family methyltransferase [Rhodovulum euryhalinum]
MSRGRDARRTGALIAALAPERRLRILDVGANPLIEGEVSYRKLLDLGHAEVVGFEPQPDALAALNARKSQAETYLPHVLGDGSRQVLHLTRAPGFTSVYPADPDSARLLGFADGMAEIGATAVETRRLDDLPQVPRVDFLKIDVQGSERAILAHGRDRLAEAIAVQTEVRMFQIYRGEPSHGDLETELAAQGFRFLRFATLKHVALSRRRHARRLKRAEFAQAVDGDAFFVRDLRGAGEWSDEALKRLAILADGVMDCPDLALFALDLLETRGCIGGTVIDDYLTALPAARLRG